MASLQNVSFRDLGNGLLEARCPRLPQAAVNRLRTQFTCQGMARLHDALLLRMPAGQRPAFEAAYEKAVAGAAPQAATLIAPVYLDFVSPYAFLATHQTAMLEAELNVFFDFRPWEVYPEWKPFPAWQDDPEQRARILAGSNALLRSYDIPVPDERAPFRVRTRSMHEAAEYARSVGLMKPYAKALFRAYFLDHRDVRELDVLGQIADEVGMVRRDLEEAVLSGEFADAVDQHGAFARQHGVFGVPTYVIDEQAIWGKDMLDVLRTALCAAGATKR